MDFRPFVVILPILLLIGCTSGPVCNKPYIIVGKECCLDRNDDKICDKDEVPNTTSTTTTTTSTTTTSSTTTVAKGYSGRGELVNLELSKSEVYLGEVVEVKATFRNLGLSEITSYLRCNIVSSGDEIIQVVYGEEIAVPSGQDGPVIAYFTPSKPGRYIIKGRIYYSDRMTSERIATLNVKAP